MLHVGYMDMRTDRQNSTTVMVASTHVDIPQRFQPYYKSAPINTCTNTFRSLCGGVAANEGRDRESSGGATACS
jgi:hypothetical protein